MSRRSASSCLASNTRTSLNLLVPGSITAEVVESYDRETSQVDEMMQEARQHELSQVLPDARVVVLEGQGHAAMLTAPALFMKEVEAFLLDQ